MRKALYNLFKSNMALELNTHFKKLDIPPRGLYKTRVIYDMEIREVEFVPYVVKPIKSLKMIHSDTVSYDYKYLDRTALNDLYSRRGNADDVLIVKNGCITDTSYANIIFKKAQHWYTPTHCLLKGTMRESLLNANLIKETTIDSNNYLQFESFKLINSMLGMEAEEISIESIH